MAKQRPQDFTKFKFRALKTYASLEWLAESKKKYRQVFDKSEVSQIYAELSFFNKQFDEEDWNAEIVLKAFLKGRKSREICCLPIAKHVSKDANIVYVREGWGSEEPSEIWKEGAYYWEAYINGEIVAKQPFYIYDVGSVSAAENPYMSINHVRLFEGGNADGKRKVDEFFTEFHDKETRFVWIDFAAFNKQEKTWYAELNFKFYNDARQLKGHTVELVRIAKNQKNIRIRSGWGSDYKGSWFADNYTVEIIFMDKLIGVVPFKVGEMFVRGESVLQRPDERSLEQIKIQETWTHLSLEDLLKELDAMIGLDSIKARVREYAQYLKFLKLRKDKGLKENQPINLNIVFTGNPGTGKTTVARMLGKIYNKLGLLSRGHVHEVDRSDIIGEYIGQTAPKMKAALEKAKGGILFIDEAYALARGGDDTKDYGREAIEILVKELSEEHQDMAIVVAGYPKEMEIFLDSNPGLHSRFKHKFAFPDYVPKELSAIAGFWAEKRGVVFEASAKKRLDKALLEAYRKRDRSFGNARYVQSLIDEAKLHLGLRVMKSQNPESLGKDELSLIKEVDLDPIFEEKDPTKTYIPVDEAELKEAIQELHQLVGLETVKSEVNDLVKLVRFYKEMRKDVLNSFSLHTIFTGNPGTGKTTIARVLGKIYKALGILERGHVIECDRQALVAGYLGQTAIKTAELIEKAKGGVLFIDEAYSLSQGGENDYGREAIETLLKRMEDWRREFIVIVAGYPDNMKKFLELNPGLKSRFDRKIHFPDYEVNELIQIAELMLVEENIRLAPDAKAHLATYFSFLHTNRNKYFGNARAVRKVIEQSVKNQHLRLATLDKKQRNAKMLSELIFADVEQFVPGSDLLLEGSNGRRIGF